MKAYQLDAELTPWLKKYYSFYLTVRDTFEPNEADVAFGILFEAAMDIYLSVQIPNTTTSTKGILTRCLIECYADVNAIFNSKNSEKYAIKYVKRTNQLLSVYQQNSKNYIISRDKGNNTTRPFELSEALKCWNGHNVISRVRNIDEHGQFLGFYEFFSIFTHVSGVRQVYGNYFNDPTISQYYAHIMLLIMKAFIDNGYENNELRTELVKICSNYSEYFESKYTFPKINS